MPCINKIRTAYNYNMYLNTKFLDVVIWVLEVINCCKCITETMNFGATVVDDDHDTNTV